MKYILIAAIALLALAQGSQAQDATPPLERFTQFLQDLQAKIPSQTTDLINQDLVNQAKDYLNQGREQLEPQVTQALEQLKLWASSLGDQATQVQAQYQPVLESIKTQVEEAIQKLSAPAIEN